MMAFSVFFSLALAVYALPADASQPAAVASDAVLSMRVGDVVYLYGTTAGVDDRLEGVSVEGKEARAVRFRWFPAQRGGRVFCARAELAATPSTAAFHTRLTWSGGRQTDLQGHVSPGWVVHGTQYDFPLSVVECSTEGDRVHLTLYNESNRAKPDAVVRGVLLNGRDVTARCRLPEGPLPADRHRYMEDQRFLEMPVEWSKEGSALVTLEYQLGPPRYTVPGMETSVQSRSLTVELRRGLRYPVGHTGGQTLPGCICVHHGGLRPDVGDDVLRRRLIEGRGAASDRPIYVRFREWTPAAIVAHEARGFDFCVVSPALLVPHEAGGWWTAAPDDSMRLLRASRIPFVASLVAAGREWDDRSFHWWALTMLGQGSRGLKSSSPSGVDHARWSAWLRRHGEWLVPGWPVPLDVSASEPGVTVASWVCGPDTIALMVTNEWCSLAPGQAEKPFYGVWRRGVALTVDTGSDFGPAAVQWCDGQQWIPVPAVGEGRIRVELPPFETGGLVRIRSTPGVNGGPTPAPPSAGPERGLEPSAPPFVRLGEVPIGRKVPVKLAVVNRSDFTRTIRVVPQALGTIGAASAVFAQAQAGPRESVVMTGTWTAPSAAGPAVGAVRIVSGEDPSDAGFFVFLEALVVQKFTTDPSDVDFGRVVAGGLPATRTVRVQWDRLPARVASASIEPPDARLTVTPSEDGTLQFRLDPDRPGRLSGTAQVRLETAASEVFTVRIHGEVSPSLIVRPSRLAIAGEQPVTRVLRLDAQEPVRVAPEGPIPAGLSLTRGSDGWGATHRLEWLCEPAKRTEASSPLVILCHARSGKVTRLEVPIAWIAMGDGPRANAPANLPGNTRTARPSALLERVTSLVHGFRACPIPDGCPNWVLTHTLLPFAPARSRTPEESAEFRRRLGTLLRLADRDGKEGGLSLYRGKPEISDRGRLFDRQHHPAQFLHYFAMTEVPLETPLNVPGQSWTLADLYKNWVRTLPTSGDQSWVTSALCHYQTPGKPWTDRFGRTQHLGTFVNALRRKPEPYCDWSHWVMTLARVRGDRRWRTDPSMAGEWGPLAEIVDDKVRQLRSGQAADGSFPLAPELLRGDERLTRSQGADEIVIHYTGHHLEWLTIALPAEGLRDEWVLRAVDRLLTSIAARYPGGQYFPRLKTEEEFAAAGFLSHAVSGLSRWGDKVAAAAP